MTNHRPEVQRTIAADPASIFRLLCDPQGHVAIDSSGMLMDATGGPVTAAGDSFVVHMDCEALNDYPLGRYDVTVTIATFVPDREIAWTVLGRIHPQISHVYGYVLEPVRERTLITSYYDWSSIDPTWKEALQAAVVIGTGELWLFLLQFPLANLCMCVLFARTARGANPLVARLAAEVVALRQPATHHPGLHHFFQRATWLWAAIFLLLAASLAVLMATEQAAMFLMLSTVATAAFIVAGTGASALWFRFVLRSLGLRLRFAPA